jgi:hypothetical protein
LTAGAPPWSCESSEQQEKERMLAIELTPDWPEVR